MYNSNLIYDRSFDDTSAELERVFVKVERRGSMTRVLGRLPGCIIYEIRRLLPRILWPLGVKKGTDNFYVRKEKKRFIFVGGHFFFFNSNSKLYRYSLLESEFLKNLNFYFFQLSYCSLNNVSAHRYLKTERGGIIWRGRGGWLAGWLVAKIITGDR